MGGRDDFGCVGDCGILAMLEVLGSLVDVGCVGHVEDVGSFCRLVFLRGEALEVLWML